MASSSASSQQQQRNGSSSSTGENNNNSSNSCLNDFKATIDMNCSVCYEVFTDPLLLKCGHTFCKKCTDSLIRCARENAQQHYHYGTPTIACPECRAEMPADKRYLVKNFRLADIISQFNLLQTEPKDAAAGGSGTSTSLSSSTAATQQIMCNSCDEQMDPKHIFCCSWCSNGRQEPFFACGTCCVTKHPQHPLTRYSQMTTLEERQSFVNNTIAMLRDASSSIQAQFTENSTRISPELQNIKNQIYDSFVHWDPVLNNLRTNTKLSKQAIEDHNIIVDSFLRLCFETIDKVKQIELKHVNDLNGLRESFSTRVTAAFDQFSQSSNSPVISLPSTSSVTAQTGSEFVYSGPNRHHPRPRRVARRRTNNGPLRATVIYPTDIDRHPAATSTLPSGRPGFQPLQAQRMFPVDSDEDL